LVTYRHSISNPDLKRAAIVFALLGVAVALRLYGIAVEPLWHDEAISVSRSERSIAEVMKRNVQDVRPPLYYIGLRIWRSVLDDSAAHLRSYSTAWSLVGLLALFLLARDIGGWRAAVIALTLAVVNPLDIYFAQETRNYSQTAALCTLGSWCLWRWMIVVSTSPRGPGWWRWAIGYTLCATAALYTHFVSVLVLVAQGIFALVWFGWHRYWAGIAGYALSTVLVTLGFLPWFFLVKQATGSASLQWPEWIPVPAISSYFSFLGREFFWGQVRTVHEHWWIPTMILPVLVLCICLRRVYPNRSSVPCPPEQWRQVRILYPGWLLAGPVLLIAVVVYFHHPIYFRPRFSMFLLSPFLVLAGIACNSMRTRAATWLGTATIGVVMLTGTCMQHHTYQKVYWKSFVKLWEEEGPPASIIFFPRQLEADARYYLKQPLSSADKREIESLLPRLKGARLWVCSVTGYGYDSWDGEFDYYQWLIRLGSVRPIAIPTGFYLQVVTVGEPLIHDAMGGRLDKWYGPLDIAGRIEGFDHSSQFHVLEYDGPQKTPFRWSLPKAWFSLGDRDNISTVILNVALPPPVPSGYRPELEIYARRGETLSGLFDSSPVAGIRDYRPDAFEIEFAAPRGPGRLWIGWTIGGVNLSRAGISGDERDLGLRINWVALVNHRN